MRSSNIIIIGVGLHAKRIYLPILFKHKKNRSFNLKFGVDLLSKRKDIEEYLKLNNFELNMIYLKDYDNTDGLSQKNIEILSALVKENGIEGVIISTEPLAHKSYALWAISQGLNILMDKPISTRVNVSHDINEAKGIYKDYEEILDACKYPAPRERRALNS
ncbi:MAG: Gfo/Idh/MocA family oxidoreductase [Candidatus Staskawiczbacteria bacterium]|nr:Gfo/Idh/MocA family oxidoreductase [Candidatus Staskawiczbacteria bacterium]